MQPVAEDSTDSEILRLKLITGIDWSSTGRRPQTWRRGPGGGRDDDEATVCRITSPLCFRDERARYFAGHMARP